MSRKVFMLDVITDSTTRYVEVDENKTLKECLEIANKIGKSFKHGYIIRIGRYITAGGEDD